VRGNVARWFAGSQLVGALMVDDTGLPKEGAASPCVARVGTGFDWRTLLTSLHAVLAALEQPEPSFEPVRGLPRSGVHWVEPDPDKPPLERSDR